MKLSKAIHVIFKFLYKKSRNQCDKFSFKLNRIRLSLDIDSLGHNVKPYGYPKLYYPERIRIGSSVSINHGVVIGGLGGVTIGNGVRISDGVMIHSGYLDPVSREIHLSKPVVIGDSVWLASGSIILPGVKIGEGSIVAAGAVVTKDVPNNSFVVGVPAVCKKKAANK